MSAVRTLNLELSANVDGFAAQLLDQLAEQFEVAADQCRAAAEALRDEKRVVHRASLTPHGVTLCCGRLDSELAEDDKLTGNDELVTCSGVAS